MGKNKWSKVDGFKYDSLWEESLVNGVMKDFKYHPSAIEYTKPETNHKYTPDWVYFLEQHLGGNCDVKCKRIYIEAKGRFRSREEMQKYIWIKQSLKKYEELVFLFQKPNQPVFGVKARKDGTKMSHAEWAEKNNFRWFTEDTIRGLLDGK